MEHQCDVEVMKISNGFLVRRGSQRLIDHRVPPEDLYCFENFSSLRVWLHEHFREERKQEEGEAGWISLLDSAPEPGQRVIVWAEGKTGFPFVLDYEGGGLTTTVQMAEEIALVTHWMPMPDPPSGALDCSDCAKGIHHVKCRNS